MLNKFRILIIFLIILLFTFNVIYANTNGTEMKIIDQPEKLVLQLGKEWAGSMFALKTDAGDYPVTIVVGDDGILTMELGGSNLYILSHLNSVNNVAEPESKQEENTIPEPESINDTGKSKGLFIYLGGLLLAAVLWIIFDCIKKKRQQISCDEDDY